MNVRKIRHILAAAILISGLTTLSGCGEKKNVRPAQGNMDNVSYHVLRGNDALIAKNYSRAGMSFQKALDLNPDNPAALSGKAVSDAYLLEGKKKEPVFSLLEKAGENAETDQQKGVVLERKIQVHVILKYPENSWFEVAEDAFEQIHDSGKNSESASFYMARAYAENGMYDKAGSSYQKVMSFQGKYQKLANQEYEILQKIERAKPTSQFGKTVAFIPAITKADIAALFMAELKLDQMYRRNQKQFDNSYKVPGTQKKFKGKGPKKPSRALDINGHPLQMTIQDILKMKIRGLEADANHRFYPDQAIKRAEYAVMLEDLMIKITKDGKLATKYIGQPSPFPDVRPDAWFYNAARVMTEKGIMTVTNKVNSRFSPLETVTGADALLAVSEFKQALKN